MKRLDNLLANSGYGSRKDVQKIIKGKRVSVNGNIITKVSEHVDVAKDKVMVDGETLIYREFVYLMMNKPSGFVSAVHDKFDRVVLDLIDEEDKILEPYPIGRLDKDTVGLLIISNDGEMCHRVLSPKRHVPKKYFVYVDGILKEEYIKIFKDGVILEDGTLCKEAILNILDDTSCYLTITEGKFHQVKRMFESLSLNVTYLKRVEFSDIKLDESLKEGEYRHLTDEEIEILKRV